MQPRFVYQLALASLLALLSVSFTAWAGPPVTANTPIKKGDKLEALWNGQWYAVEVLSVTATGARIHYVGYGANWDETVPRAKLRLPDGATARNGGSNRASGGPAKSAAASNIEQRRIWTDATGKFKIDAEIIELADGQVSLKKVDGKIVKVPLDKLSEPDRLLAKVWSDQGGAAGGSGSENPFDGGEETPAGGNAADAAAGEMEESRGKLDSAQPLVLDADWTYQPDAASAPAGKLSEKAVLLGGSTGGNPFWDKYDNLMIHPNRREALITLINAPPGGSKTILLERCDLASGKSQGTIPMSQESRPLDVSPGGTRLLGRIDGFHHGEKARLDVWDLAPKAVKPLVSWRPYGEEDRFRSDVGFAAFADDEHVLTVGANNKLALWRVPSLEGVYVTETRGWAHPALSANRKYMAINTEGGVAIVETVSGKAAGKLPGDTGDVNRFAFHPSGRKLAGVSTQRVVVWDLTKGQLEREIFLSSPISADRVDWVDDNHVLVNNESLVDLERRVVLWKYYGAQTGMVIGGKYWYVAGSNNNVKGLIPLSLPHSEAKSMAGSLPPDSLLVLAPGRKVNVTANGIPPDMQQGIVSALTAKLKALGIEVGGGGVTVEAMARPGKEEKVSYHFFGTFGRTERNVQTRDYEVAIKENGRTLWQSIFHHGAPGILNLRDGQGVDQALEEHMKFKDNFFRDVKLPQYVARPGEKGAYGASNLTAQGAQTTPVR